MDEWDLHWTLKRLNTGLRTVFAACYPARSENALHQNWTPTVTRALKGSCQVILWISSHMNLMWVKIQVCVTAWRLLLCVDMTLGLPESLWRMQEFIKLRRSIKMSGFYRVRWEEEWLCGLRGQVNNSELDCPGLFVQCLGLLLKALLLLCALVS